MGRPRKAIKKATSSIAIAASLYDDLSLLAWSRGQQGGKEVSCTALVEASIREYLAEHKEEIGFLKNEVAEMNRRQAELFGK